MLTTLGTEAESQVDLMEYSAESFELNVQGDPVLSNHSVSTSLSVRQFSTTSETPVPTDPYRVVVVRPKVLVPSLESLSDADLMAEVKVPVWSLPIHQHRGETRLVEAMQATEVGSGIAGQLQSISKDGDSAVVWLLDQSLSMQQDLQVLGESLKDTLIEIEKAKTSLMFHRVVAFGDKATVVLGSTTKGFPVANAIYHLPQDPSGIENTFQAVEWAVHNLVASDRSGNRSMQRLLIIWTDESGDDYLRLEDTIRLCRQANVRVDVIGPSAVLGAQRGYTKFRHPENKVDYYLPVTRGPDSAFREKPYFPYWFRSVPSDYDESVRGPYQGTSPRWHGGTNFESMLSGFSPYALTRLAKETGGIYTIYDRPGDRAPFTSERMKDYLPDYRNVVEIDAENRRYPLRMAVQQVAELSSKDKYEWPTTRLGGWVYTPKQFHRSLPQTLNGEIRTCERLTMQLLQYLALFGEEPIERLRNNDPSKRWQAWTDLCYGRLLFTSVRVREYLLTVQQILENDQQLVPASNYLELIPSPNLRGGEMSASTLAEAKRLLERCAKEHHGTPWQFLAEAELANAAGFSIVQSYSPPPPPQKIRPSGVYSRGPRITLPNL